MDVTLRRIEKKDYASVNSLIVNELGYRNSSLDDLCNRLDIIQQHNDYHTIVALVNEEVIGFIGLSKSLAYEFTGEYMRIVALAVSSDYQNRGIGTMLIESAKEYAKNKNVLGLNLISGFHREGAHAFYEKKGFKKNGYHFVYTNKL